MMSGEGEVGFIGCCDPIGLDGVVLLPSGEADEDEERDRRDNEGVPAPEVNTV
jgi:hypothetical protein